MPFDEFDQERMFHEAWDAVEIVRPVRLSLFTFGETVLSYYLVCGSREGSAPLAITQGDVRIKRPMIMTADNARPEFRNFFENAEEEGVVQFLLARTAKFSNLQFVNENSNRRVVNGSMDGTVDELNQQLDDEEQEGVAILTAPPNLAGVAVLKYVADRVFKSAPGNIQELRERGFLP